MRGHIEELSDAQGGNCRVKAPRVTGKVRDSSVSDTHRSEKKGPRIIFKLSNGHIKNGPAQQESVPVKPRPRIIIKRPQRPVELDDEAPPDPLPSSPLFEESEDEKLKPRKHEKKRHRKIEDYTEYPEVSSPSFLDSEEDEGELQEEEVEDEEEEEHPRESKKHKKKRRKKIEMVDDSDDEDFDPMAEMRRKKSIKKSGDFFGASTQTLPNLLVERIDNLGDEAINKNLHEISRPAVAVPLVTPGFGHRSDDNPIIKTLQKCHRIAASLKSELKATSTSDDAVATDRYAEVDASAAKIVSQVCLTRHGSDSISNQM